MKSDKIQHIVPGHTYDNLYPFQVTLEFKKETIDQLNVLRNDILETIKETIDKISKTTFKLDVEIINPDVRQISYEVEVIARFGNPNLNNQLQQYATRIVDNIFNNKIRDLKAKPDSRIILDLILNYEILTKVPKGYRVIGTIGDRYIYQVDFQVFLKKLDKKINIFDKHVSKVIKEENIDLDELIHLCKSSMYFSSPLQILYSGKTIEYTTYLDQMEYVKRS